MKSNICKYISIVIKYFVIKSKFYYQRHYNKGLLSEYKVYQDNIAIFLLIYCKK